MNLLPVAHRELRVAARRDRTYYGRMLAAAVALGVLLLLRPWARLAGFSGGRETFVLLSILANGWCLIAGVYLTAEAISRERQDGTLGFLFLSHLTGWDVVLGKLAAHATQAFYGLLATMPILALPFLSGGVSAGEFWWAMLVLVNTLFFATSLGLMISAAGSEPRSTRNAATWVVLLCWVGLPALANALPVLGTPAAAAVWLPRLSPLTALGLNPAGPGGVNPGAAAALAISHLEAWLFLAAAAWLTARVWRERPPGRTGRRWWNWWRNFHLGSPRVRTARRRRLVERGAFYWLFARRRWKPVGPLALVGLALAALAIAWWGEGGAAPPLGVAMLLGFTLHVLLKFWIAGEAASVLVQHRREGTFELLLSTPLTVRDILSGQFRALRWQFGPAVLATALLTAAYPLMWSLLDPDWHRDTAEVAVPIALLAAAALVGDAWTLAWLATWRALAARRYQHAAGSAVFRALVLPWLVLIFLALGSMRGGFAMAIMLWVIVGFVSDLLWIVYSRDRLLRDFRAAAVGQLETSPPAGLPDEPKNPAAAK